MVRQRSRTGQNKSKRSLSRKNSTGSMSEMMVGKEDGKEYTTCSKYSQNNPSIE